MRKALAVGRKELRQILRDRRTLLILLFIPAFFLLLYGYALNFDIRHVALAVEDRDHSAESRRLVSAFVNSGYFDLAASVTSEQEISDLMDRNRVRAVLVIPEGSRARRPHRAADRGRRAHRRRQREHGDDGDGLRRHHHQHRVAAATCRRRSVRAGPPLTARAARLVQPGAPQHAVPRARASSPTSR